MVFLILLCNSSCKKESAIVNSPIRFNLVDMKHRLIEPEKAGILVQDNKLTIFCSETPFEWALTAKFNYDLNSQLFTTNNIQSIDSSIILSITPSQSGKHIAVMKNYRYDTIDASGNKLFRLKIGFIDDNGNVQKQASISGYPNDHTNICRLSNGNYCASFIYYNSIKSWSDLYIWDAELNLIKKQSVDEGLRYNNINEVACYENKIVALFRSVYQNDSLVVNEYNFAGDKLKTNVITIPIGGYFQLLPAKSGYKVFGYFSNTANYEKFILASFDASGNLQSKKFLTNSDFSSSNEIINFKFALSYDMSNIIFHNNKYYFTLLVYDKSGNLSKTKNKFVRFNDDFEIEKLQTVETAFFNDQTYRYLVLFGEQFIAINATNWSGLNGLSFIKIDADGNIVY